MTVEAIERLVIPLPKALEFSETGLKDDRAARRLAGMLRSNGPRFPYSKHGESTPTNSDAGTALSDPAVISFVARFPRLVGAIDSAVRCIRADIPEAKLTYKISRGFEDDPDTQLFVDVAAKVDVITLNEQVDDALAKSERLSDEFWRRVQFFPVSKTG